MVALNHGVVPLTRELGSLGTGDLTNLADIGLNELVDCMGANQPGTAMLEGQQSIFVVGDGTSKSVFRQAMRGIVPDAILDRRDKIGFATPEQCAFFHEAARRLHRDQGAEIVVLGGTDLSVAFGDVVRSEWTKVRSIRSTTVTMGVTAVLVVGIGALICVAVAHSQNPSVSDPTTASLAMLVLAHVSSTIVDQR